MRRSRRTRPRGASTPNWRAYFWTDPKGPRRNNSPFERRSIRDPGTALRSEHPRYASVAPHRPRGASLVALVALLLGAAGCGAEEATATPQDGGGRDAAVRDLTGDDGELSETGGSDADTGDTSDDNQGDTAIEALCPTTDECLAPVDRVDGVCQFEPTGDGTLCTGTSDDACVTDFACLAGSCEARPPTCSARRPVVFVHGINGSSANFSTMIDRLINDGWPEESLFTFDAEDPSWGCNVDNAAAIADLVDEAIASTCQPRVDLVAHSMGTLSSRYFVKNLGGQERVNTFVTLGGMHHGLFTACLAPDFLGVCVWQEICESGDFIEALNSDPATPGELNWVSMYGTADEDVPNDSSYLEGAENIELPGVEHSGDNGLLERRDVYEEVRRVLLYPCW